MRYLLLTSFLGYSVFFCELSAQSGFVYNPENIEAIIGTDEIEPVYKLTGSLANTASETLEIDWKIIDLDLPSQWAKQVLIDNFEYVPFINESHSPTALEMNAPDIRFDIWVYPDNQSGCGTLKVVFSEHTTGTVLDTVAYLLSINDVSCVTTNTTSALEESIHVFPNPTNGLLQITNSEAIRELSLYDLSGNVLLSQKTSTQEVDMRHLSAGMYILKIHHSAQANQFFKVLKY